MTGVNPSCPNGAPDVTAEDKVSLKIFTTTNGVPNQMNNNPFGSFRPMRQRKKPNPIIKNITITIV